MQSAVGCAGGRSDIPHLLGSLREVSVLAGSSQDEARAEPCGEQGQGTHQGIVLPEPHRNPQHRFLICGSVFCGVPLTGTAGVR